MEKISGDDLKKTKTDRIAGDQTPFAKPLKKSEINPYQHHAKLRSLDIESGERIVRTLELSEFGEKSIKVDEDRQADSAFEVLIRSKKLFDELREEYGINVQANFVIGKDNSRRKPIVYILTNRIEGESLNYFELIKSEEREIFIDQLEKTYLSIVRYLSDKYKSGEYFLWDIEENRQYVYGKKRGDADKKIYLVDVDPRQSMSKSTLFYSMRGFWGSVRNAEANLGVRFESVRSQVKSFLDNVSDEDKLRSEFDISWMLRSLDT